jgi:hypothetical protein
MEGFYLKLGEGMVKMEQAGPANLRKYEADLSNGLEKPVRFSPSVRTEEFY